MKMADKIPRDNLCPNNIIFLLLGSFLSFKGDTQRCTGGVVINCCHRLIAQKNISNAHIQFSLQRINEKRAKVSSYNHRHSVAWNCTSKCLRRVKLIQFEISNEQSGLGTVHLPQATECIIIYPLVLGSKMHFRFKHEKELLAWCWPGELIKCKDKSN